MANELSGSGGVRRARESHLQWVEGGEYRRKDPLTPPRQGILLDNSNNRRKNRQ